MAIGINTVSNINSSYSSKNFNLPTIPDDMPTSGMYKTSDGAFKEKILDIARKEVAAGKNSRGSDEWKKLQTYYMSKESPDRSGIVNKALSKAAMQMKSMQIMFNKANFFLTLFKNNQIFGNKNIGNNFMQFHDGSGNLVAQFRQNGGWDFFPTSAEQARSQEFMAIWDNAIKTAEQEIYNTQNVIDAKRGGHYVDLGESIKAGTPLDWDKLAAHGITYDSATGKTIVNMDIRA